jgi:hypothetical protein
MSRTERSYIHASVVTTVEETTAEERHVVAGVVGLSIPTPALATTRTGTCLSRFGSTATTEPANWPFAVTPSNL